MGVYLNMDAVLTSPDRVIGHIPGESEVSATLLSLC